MRNSKKTVDADLAAKGLSVSPGAPDFLVSAHMGKSGRVKRKDVKTTGGAAGRIKEVPEETYLLGLAFIDPESKRVLWGGVRKGEIRGKNPPRKSGTSESTRR